MLLCQERTPALGRSHPTTTLPTIPDLDSGASSARLPTHLCDANPIPDPSLDISPPVPDVLADSEANWAFSPVPPCVQGLDRNIEECGQILDSEQAVVVVHDQIIEGNPFGRMSCGCQSGLVKGALLSAGGPACRPPWHPLSYTRFRELEGS